MRKCRTCGRKTPQTVPMCQQCLDEAWERALERNERQERPNIDAENTTAHFWAKDEEGE